jgi:hypothetical protein
MKKICFTKNPDPANRTDNMFSSETCFGTEFRVVFSSAEWFRTEFRAFASNFVPWYRIAAFFSSAETNCSVYSVFRGIILSEIANTNSSHFWFWLV